MIWFLSRSSSVLVRSVGMLAVFAFLLAAATPAIEAKGTARIQQSGGTIQTYPGVNIAIVSKTLRIRTADGKGTLVITKAACSFAGELQRCLPDSVTLEQSGRTNPIDLERGTVYLNLTGESHALPLSSTQIAPHHILLAMSTKKGTYLSVSGQIDEQTK